MQSIDEHGPISTNRSKLHANLYLAGVYLYKVSLRLTEYFLSSFETLTEICSQDHKTIKKIKPDVS